MYSMTLFFKEKKKRDFYIGLFVQGRKKIFTKI